MTKSAPLIWHYVYMLNSTVKISSVCVAFLENMNFNKSDEKINSFFMILNWSWIHKPVVQTFPTLMCDQISMLWYNTLFCCLSMPPNLSLKSAESELLYQRKAVLLFNNYHVRFYLSLTLLTFRYKSVEDMLSNPDFRFGTFKGGATNQLLEVCLRSF